MVRKIIWLPLESLDERYTKMWAYQWPNQFKKDDVDFITIEGTSLTSKIELGSVLDAYSTNHWKMTQMANLIKYMQKGLVTSDDVILFADLWSPGIEALQYIGCLGGIRPKITGVLHAGTYDPNDFTYIHRMRPWGHNLEQAWFQMYDLIFVGTQSHKNIILRNHNVNPDKIKVTGLPFYPDEFVLSRKNIKKISQRIVFPHRLDSEKQPDEFVALMDMLQVEFPEMTYMMTAKHRLSKEKYYDELAKSEICVSMALHENWGYAMLEATALGCIPLVPNRLSYCELYDRKFRYASFAELVIKLRTILSGKGASYENEALMFRSQANKHKKLGENAISKMIEYLRQTNACC